MQKPLTQSSSSAHSSSLVHFLAFLHAPAWHEPPGPHSPSDAHGLHEPAWQTSPFGHWSSLMHCAFTTHAFAWQLLPLGHWESSVHSTHLFWEHTCGDLQSLSVLQPGCFGLLPQAAIAQTTIAIATRTFPMGET